MKNQRRNYWKIALTSIFIVLGFLIILSLINYNNNAIYESANLKWKNHQTILNNDLKFLSEYLEEYQNVKTASDISYLNAKISPRLDILDLHLFEARQFLNQYKYLFSNGVQLRASIDEKIVSSQTIRNNINTFVEEYNRGIEEYNNQIKVYYDLFKLLV